MTEKRNTDGHKCLCGCGKEPAYMKSLYMPGHHPPLKGKDNPLWKGDQGTAGARAFAKLKKDPEKMEERRKKRREWESKKTRTDPEWYNKLLERNQKGDKND